VAVGLTNIFQAMPTFWLIMAWIILWIAANATIVHFDPLPWPLLLCLASVPQLPLMIVIMVGQGLLGRKQELQSEEQYNTTIKTYHDIEQIMAHLSAQDEEILKQTHMIMHLLKVSGISPEQFLSPPTTNSLGTEAVLLPGPIVKFQAGERPLCQYKVSYPVIKYVFRACLRRGCTAIQ
jgi:Protein of unknown function (DUF1003)